MLNLKNKENREAVETMIETAAIAWANWQNTVESSQALAAQYHAEYMTVAQCIDLFITDTFGEIIGCIRQRGGEILRSETYLY